MKSVNCSWWVQRWAELYPYKAALIVDHVPITYRELNIRTNRTASWLQDTGIEKGDRVAVLLDNCPEFIELYLACARLGAIFVPLNFRLTAGELDYLIRNCRPRLFVFGESVRTAVDQLDLCAYRPPLQAAIVRDGIYPAMGQVPSHHSDKEAGTETNGATFIFDYHRETAECSGRQPALTPSLAPTDLNEAQVIMYTSGTTGWPKGAVLTHAKTFFNCLNADIFFELSFHDIMLVVLPLFHSGGLFIQTSPCLYKGATLVLHRHFDPVAAYEDIERYQVTKFLGVPTVYRSLFKVEAEGRAELTSLRVCAIGGEKLTPETLVECWNNGFPVRQVMGQTETSILLWSSEQEVHDRPGSVGRPVFHAEVDVWNDQGMPVATDEVGEIVVRGSVLMKEYWQEPAQTEWVLRGGWLHTGDLARRDRDGYYYLVDRAKDMYISGGENVYPAEVERVLAQHPAVHEVAIIGVADDTWGEVGHAFIISTDGHNAPCPEELAAWTRRHLAGYKVPRHFTFCDDFPRTALGKVRKFMLKQMLQE
ncbi:MAG: long-chain fatty acid--CoA ligase [Actinobacteria bacterium]|nr:long-chain fatty acid--CoA ligase [Actinomycetota bacterium]